MERNWREASKACLAPSAEKASELKLGAGIADLDGEDTAAERADASGIQEVRCDAGLGEELFPGDTSGEDAALDGADKSGLGIEFGGDGEFVRRSDACEPGTLQADESGGGCVRIVGRGVRRSGGVTDGRSGGGRKGGREAEALEADRLERCGEGWGGTLRHQSRVDEAREGRHGTKESKKKTLGTLKMPRVD